LEVPSSGTLYSYLTKSFSKKFKKKSAQSDDLGDIDLLNNLEDYFNTTIREVMIPRTKMKTIDKRKPIQEAIRLILETGHSRLPVQDKKRDNIVGVLYAIDLFKYFNSSDEVMVSEVMRKPFFVTYSQQIHQLLTFFRNNRVQLAIVIDEHGGVDGLVTTEDVIEELVGDMPDEFNKNSDPSFKNVGNGTIIMDANYPLDQFNELYNTDFQKEGIETIGGYICHSAGKILETGEEIVLNQIKLTVHESNERRLKKLRITESEPGS